jgi:tetratricopeptide (TPR) repeat protein
MRILSNHSIPNDNDHEVLCFSGTFQDNAYFDSQRPCFFPDILNRMPAGWEPDIVLFKSPLYFAVPYGIEQSPYPTVLLLDDWFGGVDYLPDSFAKFDYIFTDKTSVALLRSLGFSNVDYWPLFAFSPLAFRLMPGERRVYDVTFTGNFNANVQAGRLPWLRRLTALDKKYSVRLFHQAWHEEYTQILNRSRIVFNHSIKSEMNQRAFEAPACGALLFMEEDNSEVLDFFAPGKECVLYNDRNFESLLDHYLSNEDERAAIARRGYERVQDFSTLRMFGGLIDKIKSLGLTAGRGRGGRRLRYAVMPEHGDFVQASLSKFGRGESTLKNATLLLSRPEADSLLLNDCAVILMTYADDMRTTLGNETHDSLAAQALALLSHALLRTPGHLTAEFNRAQVLLFTGRKSEAGEIYKRLIAAVVPDSYDSCKGLAYPLHYGYPLRYAWNMALTGTMPDSKAMAMKRHTLIRFFSATNLAAIAQERENPSDDEAMRWYEEANSLVPCDPQVTLALSRLYMRKKHPNAHGLAATVMSVNPFCVDFWKEWALYLAGEERSDDARQFIDSCLLCLSRLQSATPEIIEWFEVMRKRVAGK